MAENPERNVPRATPMVAAAVAAVALLWCFPLFRIVPLNVPPVASGVAPNGGLFDPTAAAARIWNTDLRPAADRVEELSAFAGLLRTDPLLARKRFARTSGLGTAYYFVRGSGRVVSQDRNSVRVGLDGATSTVVALRIGPVFGNTVRDGCGLLDVNAFPGLTEFNAVAAELNALVEKNIIPVLRDKAAVGTEIQFAGCAEAPETAGGPDEPLLTLIPVKAELR